MAPPPPDNRIYSATYSNVPVYEFNIAGNHVMRRRSDDWINATHILKVADFDKPARTRILEREVQKGVHEKVQGGYGKYQGTWIPLHDGRMLAERNGVLEKLRPMLDFVPGDRSPPPAPKHATASSRPRQSRVIQKRAPILPHISEDVDATPTNTTAMYEQHASETPDNMTIVSESFVDDYGDGSGYTGGHSRKRKRYAFDNEVLSVADQQHQLWADELLDYFMFNEAPLDPHHRPPTPPPTIDLNRAIDDKGHTAMHWAAAMGDLAVVRDLMHRGASVDQVSHNGETPLMRAVIFTNNYDKRTMEKLAGWLIDTVAMSEWFGSTVFHHIAATTSSKSKYACARYYLDCILNRMTEHYTGQEIEAILNKTDRNGDTAITIAARNGARKCVRSLIGRNAAVDIPNDLGETADELIIQLNHRRRERGGNRALSSSPFQMDPQLPTTASALMGPPPPPPLNGSAHTSFSVDGSSVQSHPLLAAQAAAALSSSGHKSEAATALTSQIFPLLQAKSQKLAATFDAELAERDAEVAEAERVAQLRQEEIEQLKRQAVELAMRDRDARFDEDEDKLLDDLRRDVEGAMEEEQVQELNHLVQAALRDATQVKPGKMDKMDTDDSSVGTKVRLLMELQLLREQRIALVKEVVENQSAAGLGERQADYRRLITGALGVREEDVEGMLPDIVAELEEESSYENHYGVAGDAMMVG